QTYTEGTAHMNKTLLGALLAVLTLGAGVAPATAATGPQTTAAGPQATAVRVKAVDLAGTVALSKCSGSLVRAPSSQPDDPALVMSNGHCLQSGSPGPGEVVRDQPSTRSFTLLDGAGGGLGTLRADRVAYGTMTDTDVWLYQLTSTYAQIESGY